MEEDNKVLKSNKKKPAVGMLVLIVILAVVIVGLAFWAIGSLDEAHKEKVEKEAQRTEFKAQLDSLMAIHNKIKAEYGQLSDSLAVKDSVIQARAIEIKKLMNTRWEYYKIKKKLGNLQKIAQGYVRQMDSLYTENHALTKENHQIKEVLRQEKYKNAQLMTEKKALSQKVEQASVLQTFGYQVTAVHITGAGRERKTDKVRRTSMIKVCFTVAQNDVAKSGLRTIYVRIAKPNKKILVVSNSEEYSFMYNGKRLQYTAKKEINYQHQAINVCMEWLRRSTLKLKPGLYKVDVFEDNNSIGHTSFSLR
jgi:regulator of replication initiation timing